MRHLKFIISFLFPCLLLAFPAWSQDDLTKIMDQAQPVTHITTIATFKATRIINLHTVEVLGKRTLDFRISHRFGTFHSGSENLYGLDGPANIRLDLEYSYNGRLMVGLGRSSFEKMMDGFLKYRLIRQTEDNHVPLSVTLLANMYYTLQKDNGQATVGYDLYMHQYSRMSYEYEIIIAKKFTNKFSFQLTPYLLHYNQVQHISDKNDIYGVSCGLRYKVTRSMAITAEYAYNINDYSNEKHYNNLGIGFEIETGGHVFQMHVVNSFGIVENQFLAHTTDKWSNAGIRLGFNISRVFRV